MNDKFPRSPADKVCALRGTIWNQAADAMEAFGRLQVAPPLMLDQTPNGPMIRLTGITLTRAKITGKGGCGASWYSGRLQIRQSADFDPSTDLTMSTYYQDASGADDCWIVDTFANGMPTGVHRLKTDGSYYVWGQQVGTSIAGGSLASRPIIEAVAFPTGVLLPCTLSNPTGSAGTNSPPTAASYAYDITDLDGTVVQTGVSVISARQPGHVTAATKGIYYTDFASAWHVIWCDEVIDAYTCP
jgi:hypothetical protein